MSQLPELPEAGWENLRRAIQHLPTHEPNPATWSTIQTHLDAAATLPPALSALPQHEPDDATWDFIAARLDELAPPAAAAPEPAEAVVRPLWPAHAVRRALAIAASVLLLLGVWWQQRPAGIAAGPRETVAFSEEEVAAPLTDPATTAPADPLEAEGRSFIDAHCSSLPTACESGEFHTLRTQLTELDAQEQQLRQDARRFGASPELLRQQAQLTTLKAAITRELVQLIIS